MFEGRDAHRGHLSNIMKSRLGGSAWWREELEARRAEEEAGPGRPEDEPGERPEENIPDAGGGRFRDIFEKAAVGMVLEDAEGRLVESNPALQSMLGYDEEELRGMARSGFTHPEDEGKDARLYEELLRGEREGFRIEKRYVRKDGSTMRGFLSATALTGEEPAFVVGVIEDIDERKEAEGALEKRYRAVVQQSPEGIFLMDATSQRILETNPVFCALLGYEAGEIEGMEIYDLVVHPREDVDAAMRRTLEQRSRFIGEWRLRRKDGAPLEVEVSVGVMSHGGKEAVCIMVRDATERREVEEGLREAEERFRVAFQEAPIGISLVGLDNRYIKVNPAFCALLGRSERELVGRTVAEFTHPEDVDISKDYMRRVLRGGDKYELQKRYLRAGGRPVWVSLNVSLVRDPDGEPSHYICHHQDLTERKEAEEALRDAERRMGAVIQQSPLSIHIFTPEGRSLIWNASWNELWGLEEDESPEGASIFEDEQLAESGLLDYVEESLGGVRVVTPPLFYDPAKSGREGSSRWLEAYVYPVRDEDGDVREMVLVIEDVTGREEARENLEKSEERFRSLIQNSSDIVMILETDGTIRYESPAGERILGYRNEERLGTRFFDYIHPEDVEQAKTTFEEVKESPGVWPPTRFRKRHKDGSWRHVEVVRNNLLDDPNVNGIVANLRDVTDRVLAEEELRLKDRAISESSNAIVITDPNQPDNPMIYVNPAFERDTGYTAEEAIGWNCRFLQGTDRDQPAIAELSAAVREERETTVVLRNYKKDGTLFYNEVAIYPVRDEDGRLTNYVGVQENITERVRAEEELKLRNRAIEASSNGILICDMTQEDYPIVYSNSAMARITGYEPEEILDRNPRFLQGVDRDQIEARRLSVAIAEGREWFGVIRNYKKDGTMFYNEMYVAPVRDEGGSVTHYVGVQNDVTERRAMEEQLAYQAFHDPLTGLPNRALFKDRLDQALSRADRHGNAVAVLFMDLDNFKYVNDSLGHEAGDELLIGVAERLRWDVRPGDSAARLGGDEFAVLLEEVGSIEDATKVAERVAEELREPLMIRSQEVFASASIGVATSARGGGRAGDLLRDADAAMYEAKEEGRNRYKVFEASMGARASERLGLENALRRALRRGELRLHYQPEVLLRDGRTVGVEALLRWERPGRGLVSPAEFIPLAEETGLIVPMGHWVLREACRQAKQWRERYDGRHAGGGAPTVWVNLSARQLHQTDLAEEVSSALKEAGLPPENLGLEITESVLVEYGGTAISTLDELKVLGVKLAIDDFGTGYSSLSYLKRLPVDLLKIDRSFVAGIDKSPEDAVLVSAVINLSQALNLRVIAEGVETEDQLRKLRSLGCDLAQGYLFSHPLPPDAAPRFLEEEW